MNNNISRLSSQPIYVPVQVGHPIDGVQDLAGTTAEIAVVQGDPKVSDFEVATLQTGTWRGPDGEQYHIFSAPLPSNMNTGHFNVWIKFTFAGDDYVMRTGDVEVY